MTVRMAAGVLALAAIAAGGCSQPRSPSEFSVVLVTLDTTRADRIGAFGGTAVPTPTLDRLAREGVAFTSAFSQVPLTLPAHSSILTGRYPASHGVRHNGLYRLPDGEVTLAEHLKQAGFRTAAMVGAFVLNEPYGTGQGFDVYDDIDTDRYQGGRDNQYEAQRSAEQVNERVFAWLDGRPAGRFFLWVHYYDPHLPYAPPAGTTKPLQGSGYDREISYVDASMGDLVARLERDGLLDSTLLVVVGDHGESLGEHRELSHGIFLYEGAIRVPLILRAPGLLPDGERVGRPVEIVDIVPTVLDVLDLAAMPGVQGTSLLPAVEGDDVATRPVFAETLMPRLEYGWSELRAVRTERWKYVQAPRPELYDLQSDPGEVQNLVDAEPERSADMAASLEAWTARTGTGQEVPPQPLSPEEEARLRSLGYLGGDAYAGGTSGPLPDPKDRIDEALLLNQARDRLMAGDAAGAIPLLDRLMAQSPGNRLGRSTRIQALLALRRLPEAEEEALAALADAVSDPQSSAPLVEKARRALASVYWLRGKNAEAEEQYRQAIALNKANGTAPVFPGILLGAAGGQAEAMRLVEDVLARNPRDEAALAARFELEFAAGRNQEALRTAAALAEVQGGDPDTLLKAGKLARDAGALPLAVELFRTADRKQPGDPDILGYLGTACLAAGRIDEAERALRASRKLRPSDPRAPFYLGNIALLKNDEASARALFEDALRLDPDFTPPLHNLALWLAEKGRPDSARKALEDALRRRPDDDRARSLLQKLSGGPS